MIVFILLILVILFIGDFFPFHYNYSHFCFDQSFNFFLSAFFLFFRSSIPIVANRGNTILILGIKNAGKTVLYHLVIKFFINSSQIFIIDISLQNQLKDQVIVKTYSSVLENQTNLEKNGKKYQLVDLPGSNSLRYKLKHFLPNTVKIIFVIDSTDIDKNIQNVSNYLFDLFTNKIFNKNNISLIVACNKQDNLFSLQSEKIQEKLISEM